MDIWKQKLELAEKITTHTFTNQQTNVFLEDEKDLIISCFKQSGGQTTVGLAYALVNAYWNPNSKYLYINDTSAALTHSRTTVKKLVANFELFRPERIYKIYNGNVTIGFGDTVSAVKFYTIDSLNTGDEYDVVILDTSDVNVKLKHIFNFTRTVMPDGKLIIMHQSEVESVSLNKTPNKLDEIVDSVH